jgi:hypothetical protein
VTRWYVACVGGSDQSARSIGNRARQLLVNVHPTIAGRTCGLIQQEATRPPVRNELTGELVEDIVDTYVLTTYPG